MPDIPEVRTVALSGEGVAIHAMHAIKSFVPIVNSDPNQTQTDDFVEDDGLVIGVYDVEGDAQSTDSVSNKGGALILDVRVQLVFWGSRWAADEWVSEIVSAVQTIFASDYLAGLAQYGFRTVALQGVTMVTSPDPNLTYSFDDVGNLIWSLIDEGKFPEPQDPGGRVVYMVFMPPNSTPPADERGAHSDPKDSGLFAVHRAWVGYVSYGSFDHITSVFTHELVEAITDPEPDGPAWVMTRNINGGNEIGDACNNTVDRLDGSSVLVQAYWSQRQRACVIPQGRGPLAKLQSLQNSTTVESGYTGSLYVSLDRPTPISIEISVASDNPNQLSVQQAVVLDRGQTDSSIAMTAFFLYGPEQTVNVHASYAGVTLTSQVRITPRPWVFGGYVRSTDGQAIAGAVVGVDSVPVGSFNFAMQSAADGSYTTPTLPQGTYTVEVSASGYVSATTTVVISEDGGDRAVTEVDITLEPQLPSTVDGTVTAADLTPMTGAQVLLIAKDLSQRLTTTTDESGNYSLTVPIQYTGGYWLRITAAGYTEGFLDFGIGNGSDLTENFTLSQLGLLAGTVSDAQSAAPIPGGSIRATITAPDPLTPTSLTTPLDPAGHYQLQLPPGPCALTAQSAGYEPASATVAVEAGSTTQQDFPLTPATAALVCTVSDSATGNPVGRSHVRVTGALPEQPTFDGTHTIHAIPNGPQLINISAQGYTTHQVTLDFTHGQTVTDDFPLDPTGSGPNPHRR